MIISGVHSQPRSQPQTPLLDSNTPHPSAFNSYLSERKRRAVSGGGMTPRVNTPVSVKGKGFKSSPLPVEMDIVDGAKNKGASDVTREGDGSAIPSEAVM
jgi:hypothetical protein